MCKRAVQVLGQPGALGDGLRLVLDLGLALLVLDGGHVHVLVGGDHDGSGGVALGADGAAQAGVQEGAASGDQCGRAHQGEEGAEKSRLAGADCLQGVTQHHGDGLSSVVRSGCVVRGAHVQTRRCGVGEHCGGPASPDGGHPYHPRRGSAPPRGARHKPPSRGTVTPSAPRHCHSLRPEKRSRLRPRRAASPLCPTRQPRPSDSERQSEALVTRTRQSLRPRGPIRAPVPRTRQNSPSPRNSVSSPSSSRAWRTTLRAMPSG